MAETSARSASRSVFVVSVSKPVNGDVLPRTRDLDQLVRVRHPSLNRLPEPWRQLADVDQDPLPLLDDARDPDAVAGARSWPRRDQHALPLAVLDDAESGNAAVEAARLRGHVLPGDRRAARVAVRVVRDRRDEQREDA